jgi:hypothetical protein
MSKKSKKGAATGPFVMHTREMFMSAAWRVLSLSARRLLDRIEIEMMSHGGPRSNCRLPVTYGDFIKYGVRRNSIASALREVMALGFLEKTEQGRGGNVAYRKANRFRLTYHNFKEDPDGEVLYEPTNEWRRFKTIEEAEAIVTKAIATKANSAVPPCRPYQVRQKKQKAAPQNGTVPPPEMGGENCQSPPPRNGGYCPPPKKGGTYNIFQGEGRRPRLSGWAEHSGQAREGEAQDCLGR